MGFVQTCFVLPNMFLLYLRLDGFHDPVDTDPDYELQAMLACSQALAFLDTYKGPLQWHISYNLIVLRHISFAMDRNWAMKQARNHESRSPQQDIQRVRTFNIRA